MHYSTVQKYNFTVVLQYVRELLSGMWSVTLVIGMCRDRDKKRDDKARVYSHTDLRISRAGATGSHALING